MLPERLDDVRARLSTAQMSALASMPITLGRDGTLPAWGPAGGTLKSLKLRGLAKFDGTAWVRTALGEAVWEHR